jgi:SAM-dependent methyltransferase
VTTETWILDAAVEANLPPSEYFALWEDLGRWQLDLLRQRGLRPEHRLLDVGCGAMRLGCFAIPYLDDGCYHGVDAFDPYLDLAHRLAEQIPLRKRFHLLLSSEFEFERFGGAFDYAIAQSVFTHLSAQQVDRCMAALSRVMAPGGAFLFTFLLGTPRTLGFLYGGLQPMQRSAVEDLADFEALGARHGARLEVLDVAHPTGQQVGEFRFPR